MDPNTNISKSSNSKSIKLVIGVIILLIVGGVVWFLQSQRASQSSENNSGKMTTDDTKMDMTISPDNNTSKSQEESMTIDEDGTKVFTVEGRNFTYSLKEIRVKKGDKVRIVFKNTGGFHDWVLDEFDARTPQIQDGQTAEVEFVAEKVGTFVYYCSVGNHRQMGMWGKLIVEE